MIISLEWPIRNFPGAVWQKSVNDRHIQSILSKEYLVDQRLYELVFYENFSRTDFAIVLNNIVFWLFKELGGRVNLGEGVLDTAVYEARIIKILVPNFNYQCTLNIDRYVVRQCHIRQMRADLVRIDE